MQTTIQPSGSEQNAGRMKTHVGQLIKQYRLAAGWNQSDLGEALGVPQGTISKVEGGKSEPTFRAVERISVLLQRPLEDFATLRRRVRRR
jgi:transcriptional regulator with XRE-family HTH domain